MVAAREFAELTTDCQACRFSGVSLAEAWVRRRARRGRVESFILIGIDGDREREMVLIDKKFQTQTSRTLEMTVVEIEV